MSNYYNLKIIRSPTTNSFILCTLFNSHITIQILTLIMVFREKICFYILYHFFLNQTIENMVHISYVTHNVWLWMKFAPLYKGVILIVQGKCSIGQDKCSNCTRQMFNFFFVLSSKDCTLLRYAFLYYTLILFTLFNLHMIICILIPLIMFEIKFCFVSFTIFWNKPMKTWLTYLWLYIK